MPDRKPTADPCRISSTAPDTPHTYIYYILLLMGGKGGLYENERNFMGGVVYEPALRSVTWVVGGSLKHPKKACAKFHIITLCACAKFQARFKPCPGGMRFVIHNYDANCMQ